MPELTAGAEEFDAGRFYEAHEEWEHEWLDSTGADRALLQGLIQTAAAYVHLRRGNPTAVASLAESARRHLDDVPDGHLGVDVEAVRELDREIEARARDKIESEDWRPLVLRKPKFPQLDG